MIKFIVTLIIFYFSIIELKGQNSDDLETVPYSHIEKNFTLSDTLPFSKKDKAFHIAKDSTALFFFKNETELIISVKDKNNWKTWSLGEMIIDEIYNVSFIDLTNDSIPELIFEYGFQEGIHWGGNHIKYLDIWVYKNIICLFSEKIYEYSFANVWSDSTQSRIYNESIYELNITFSDGAMIIKCLSEDNYSSFNQGKYEFQREKWIRLKEK